MFAQVSVYKEGGTYSIFGTTAKECIEKTRTYSHKIQKELLATTLPFETKGQDSSLPQDWRKDLGESFMKSYYDGQLPPEPSTTPLLKSPVPGSIRSKYAYWPIN